MSAIAGRLAAQAGAYFLEASHGGAGVLLGPVGGVPPGRVVVIGGGTVGYHAAAVSLGLGARVTVFDTSVARLNHLDEVMHGRIELEVPSRDRLEATLSNADLVVGAVLVPGARAPAVVDRELVEMMRPGSVICDVAIDQGGCVETSRPTTHSDPVHIEHDVVHYAVTNMPGGVPQTSTRALVNATLPYVRALAADGLGALEHDPGLADGLNVHEGRITHPAVQAAHGSRRDRRHEPVREPPRPRRPHGRDSGPRRGRRLALRRLRVDAAHPALRGGDPAAVPQGQRLRDHPPVQRPGGRVGGRRARRSAPTTCSRPPTAATATRWPTASSSAGSPPS